MRISAKGEYAIKAVLDLALHRDRDLIPIQEIAEREAIPQRYLEQVLLSLKRAGILTSKRGSSGGYHLTKAPDEITVGAVLRAVEGTGVPFETGASSLRPQARPRNGHGDDLAELWRRISDAVSQVVDQLTFGELAAQAAQRRAARRPMWHI